MMKSNSFLKRAPAQVAKMRRAITNKKAVPAAVAEEMVMYAAAYDDESDDFETGPLVQTQAQVQSFWVSVISCLLMVHSHNCAILKTSVMFENISIILYHGTIYHILCAPCERKIVCTNNTVEQNEV